jgi:hypothetical protein
MDAIYLLNFIYSKNIYTKKQLNILKYYNEFSYYRVGKVEVFLQMTQVLDS